MSGKVSTRITGADLRDLYDTASNDNPKPQAFRQSVLETFAVCDVEIVHEGVVAFFSYEGFCWDPQEERDVVGDCCDQGIGGHGGVAHWITLFPLRT